MVDDQTNGADRREHARYDADLSVDWANGDHFLFSYITNISKMGIFIRSDDPPPVGTELRLRFGLADADQLAIDGVVAWINPVREDGDNPNPGMGVQFVNLTAEQREQVVAVVRTIAYLQDDDATAS